MLFNLANQWAKTEDGRLFAHNDPDVALDSYKAKNKDIKCKGPAMLVAVPEHKHGNNHEEASRKPFCA
ncbi:hypothetical protein D1007_44391 [Hordeum vulgare]|nr:hypothetical protein D1007_44391 [Hordeum vulgare]